MNTGVSFQNRLYGLVISRLYWLRELYFQAPQSSRLHCNLDKPFKAWSLHIWTKSSEFRTYRMCEQRRFRRACASAQSRQNLRCSLIQAMIQEEPSDRKPDPWPLWMAGHAQLKFVMTECSKTQIRLTGLKLLKCDSRCLCKRHRLKKEVTSSQNMGHFWSWAG